MEGMFLSSENFNEHDLGRDGFFDGTQSPIPDGTELEAVVTDAFIGMEEGSAINILRIFVTVTTPGEFLGHKLRYKGDNIYGFDASKRDTVMKNLQLLDIQAGAPISNLRLQRMPTTEELTEHWVGRSHARIKVGAYTPEDEPTKVFNSVRGFGWLRSKIPATQAAAEQQVSQSQATSSPDPVKEKDDDIGF